MDPYAQILADLERLRNFGARKRIFGAQAHGFEPNPTLTEDEIRQFEAEHRVTLPPDYRDFLKIVGNGGAGPAYGVFRLGEMDSNHDHKPWRENDGFVGVLSEPFPHTRQWNDLTGKPPEDSFDENDLAAEDEFIARLDVFNETYWSSKNVNGAIPICHLGCAKREWLILTGTEAGHVWADDRVDYKGLSPLRDANNPRVTFIQWYRSWLDDSMRQVRCR